MNTKTLVNKYLNNEIYRIGREETLIKFNGYNVFDKERKNEVWQWFKEYVIEIGWTRMHVHVFYLDLLYNHLVTGELEHEFDEFYCTIIGEGILDDNWIRFPNEPKDWHSLNNYINSKKWMD